MTVRAKFECYKKSEPDSDGDVNEICLSAVYDDDPASENGRFFNATPWGEFKMGTINAAAAAQFEVGKEYYLDFTAVE